MDSSANTHTLLKQYGRNDRKEHSVGMLLLETSAQIVGWFPDRFSTSVSGSHCYCLRDDVSPSWILLEVSLTNWELRAKVCTVLCIELDSWPVHPCDGHRSITQK